MSRRSRAIRTGQRLADLAAEQPMTPGEHLALTLSLTSTLDDLARGKHPGRAEWDALADVVNRLDTLRAQGAEGIDAKAIEVVELAMARAGGRYKAGGPMRMDGAGLSLLRDLVDAYLRWCETATRREVAQLDVATRERIRAALLVGGCKVVDMEGCA